MAPPGAKRGLLERLNAGEVVIGDGGFVFALEKRGYVKAGPWTPEAAVEHPEAVRQLHREFLRAGANVMQTFTFYASDDKLENSYFEHVEEAVWAVEVLKEAGKPVAATLCIGPEGDLNGVLPGECAVKLAKAGASVVGVNCHFDPMTCVATVKLMKEGLAAAKVKAHLMTQPLAYHTPDCGKQGFIDLPEFPFALEPRIVSRWDIHKYARAAYNLGVRYIGGCCGFEPYHTRAIAEELAPERGFLPQGSEKHGSWGGGLDMHTKPWVRARARRNYWEALQPASGRPYCPSMSRPDAWGVTKGDTELMQQKEATTEEQLKALFAKPIFQSK
ncbi:PREDICTED: betaine--homocysteine S-methyltransferase 1 isoform X3 [Nanorana parkeri]|uniref:betaine--homocysteine S-methyltransferase 1 isoform X3 n=1 Tax=Nanorana parkeri TaxID=125878 RepID=UPI0008546166|nr:PREDICTED: betaine--homocysteine S-methyltransferase 1 isoform X3 [Nanorana parkeri]